MQRERERERDNKIEVYMAVAKSMNASNLWFLDTGATHISLTTRTCSTIIKLFHKPLKFDLETMAQKPHLEKEKRNFPLVKQCQ